MLNVAAERQDWDYENFPDHIHLLPVRAQELLISLRKSHISGSDVCADSRPYHGQFFSGLTPEGHGYFAGHYRGESFPRLKDYQVGINGDPRVGVHSGLVLQSMNYFSKEVVSALASLGQANQLPDAQLSKVDKLLYIIRMACKFFVEFLRVHPYANGNGHMGRFFIFCFLSMFGIWPKNWPLNDRPPDPPYSTLIRLYRDGYCEGLEQFVLRCVIG